MKNFMRFVITVVILALLFHANQHWLAIHTGTIDTNSPYYAFWSAFGSDLGEATIVTGMVAAYRHHNCHAIWCPRLGKAVEGTPYIACPKHHPFHQSHKGSGRGVHPDVIAAAALGHTEIDPTQES